ncbi:MAG: 4-hydroxythreonine-4-phosphate dehydrogenase PdxA [Bacteroidetes bacterium]|nr:4-hydroxythreonine-4-phosphate dehydrogenase PdxA [Bacteroidota bacterium]MBL7105726.1 4-hydroxythreonine-4-phosphate dehydrogenase PdxA [Bacteroidales bacterium]
MIKPIVKDNKVRVGITHGDFNGISYEIIIKTFEDPRMLEMFTPVIYGSSKVASYYRKTLNILDVTFNLIKKADYANPKRANIINCYDKEVKIEIGKLSEKAGELAYLALERAIEDLNRGKIDILVTAPINKNNIQSEKFNFSGHTDYLADKYEAKDHIMMMVSNNVRIGIITGHIPLKDVHSKISEDLVLNKINVMNKSLQMDFGINKPKIAVLGLNPHAGDGGLIGKEEIEIITPAINKANDENILTFGPYPADGFFGSANYTNFDGILAMYHDQGMIPFKAFSFDHGINFTAGLPIVRTSPAHGTAFDIAGKNIASPDSFRQAIFSAIDIYKNRKLYEELNKNPLPLKQEEQIQEPDSNVTDSDEINEENIEAWGMEKNG